GTIPERGQHLPGLAVVVVDGLLAQEHRQRLLLLDELQEYLCDVQRLDQIRMFDQHRAIRAHGKSGTQLLLHLRPTDRRHHDFLDAPFFLDTQGLLERDVVERIAAHLDAVRDDAAAIWFDTHADVEVHDTLETDEYSFHCTILSRAASPAQFVRI